MVSLFVSVGNEREFFGNGKLYASACLMVRQIPQGPQAIRAYSSIVM